MPKRLLFLTSLSWAEPFMSDFVPDLSATNQTEYVEATGEVKLTERNPSRVVVASHPQGKKEDIWVKEVICAFKSQ